METSTKIGLALLATIPVIMIYDNYQQGNGGTPIVENLLPSDMEQNQSPEVNQTGKSKYLIDETLKGKSVSVGNTSLRIRALPSVSSKIVATVINKDLGQATGQIAYADGYNWIEIFKTIDSEDGNPPIVKYGWVAKKYVKLLSVTPTATLKGKTVSVGDVDLEIRTQPNMTATIIATVSNQVLGQATGNTSNTDGYSWIEIIKVKPVVGGEPITKIGWVQRNNVILY